MDNSQFLAFWPLKQQDFECYSTSQGARMFWNLLLWIWANLPHSVCLLLHFVSGLWRVLVLWMPALSLLEHCGVGTSSDRFTEKWSVTCIRIIVRKIPGMFCFRKLCLLLWCPALQLLIVFLLGQSIIFMYAVISFAFLHGYFDAEDGLFCETLAQCFATVMREGLLDTLGTVSFTCFS